MKRRSSLPEDERICLAAVRSVAWSLVPNVSPHVHVADLISEGYVGLLEAAARFDPDRGTKFLTYAWPRIKGRMLDHAKTEWRHHAHGIRIAGDRDKLQTPEQQVLAAEERNLLKAALDSLSARKRMLMTKLLKGSSLAEAARTVAISNGRASRLRGMAHEELRKALAAA